MINDDRLDAATAALCEGQAILARWSYVLDTSDDDNYPFISYGQLLLREDGAVFQRVSLSEAAFGPWQVASRANGKGPYTAADVERIFKRPESNYTVVRTATQE